MNRDGHNGVKFFVGTEVEHTPAFGERTLFVVGIQDVTDIQLQAVQNNCTHIYFGANQSFPKLKANDQEWFKWEDMIVPFLNQSYTCTLDIDATCTEGLLEGGLIERHNFIPMISVKLPYIKQLGYNATLKLDDKDFKATNPGVWCHNIHDLQDRSVFTDWSKYTKDETIK
jgi:hypothetical protein